MKKLKTKNIICLAAALTLLTVCLFTGLKARAAGSLYSETEFWVDVIFGYGTDILQSEAPNQATILLENNTGKNLEGTVVLEFDDPFSAFQKDSVVASFEFPFTVSAGVTKTMSYQLPPINVNQAKLCVYDKSHKLLRAAALTNFYFKDRSMTIGYVSDYPGSLYANTSTAFYQQSSPVVCNLTPEQFPPDEFSFSFFDMIVLDNVDFSGSSRFTARQIELIINYVKNGGTCVIGTGDNALTTLAPFSEFFNAPIANGVQIRVEDKLVHSYVSPVYSFESVRNYLDFGVPIDYKAPDPNTGDSLQDVELVQEFSNIPVCTVTDSSFRLDSRKPDENHRLLYYKHSDYNLYISNVSFREKAFMNNPDNVSVLYDSLARTENGSEPFNRFYGTSYGSGNVTSIYELDKYLGAILQKKPSVFVFSLILLAFLGVGIVLPFVLARKKRNYLLAWLGIPIMSVAFCCLIFLYTFLVKGIGGSSNTFLFTELQKSGDNFVFSEGSALVPLNGNYIMSFEGEGHQYGRDFLVTSASKRNGYRAYYWRTNDIVSRVSYGEKTGFQMKGAGSGSICTAESYRMDSSLKPFTCEFIVHDDGSLEFILTNTTGRDISDAFVFVGGNTLTIGYFASGDTYRRTVKPFHGDTFHYDSVIKKFYYEGKIKGSDADYQDDIRGNYSYYSYISGTNYDGTRYKKLKKNSVSFNRAQAITAMSDYINSSVMNSDLFVGGFLDGDHDEVLINGKKAMKTYSENMVYQFIRDEEGIPYKLYKDELSLYGSNNADYDGSDSLVLYGNNYTYAFFAAELSPSQDVYNMGQALVYMNLPNGEADLSGLRFYTAILDDLHYRLVPVEVFYSKEEGAVVLEAPYKYLLDPNQIKGDSVEINGSYYDFWLDHPMFEGNYLYIPLLVISDNPGETEVTDIRFSANQGK